jgi:uncharacterized protein DUF1566
MKTKNIQFSTVIIIVLANLLISSPIFAQVRTMKRKVGIEQIKKKETTKIGITKKRLIAKLPVVGDFAQGGIVFWIDETGKNGLVCAKSDQSSGVVWFAGTNSYTGANDDGHYAGEANTAKIIEVQGTVGNDYDTYAALICNELQITEGGKTFDDWYLPSKQEFNLMYLDRTTINTIAISNGGNAFATGDYPSYWSSTEGNNGDAWIQTFRDGSQFRSSKSNTHNRVRAIRAFHF